MITHKRGVLETLGDALPLALILKQITERYCSKLSGDFATYLLRDNVAEDFYEFNYLSDLGLRRSYEPRHYTLSSLRRFNLNGSLVINIPEKLDQISKTLLKTIDCKVSDDVGVFSFVDFVDGNTGRPSVIFKALSYYVNITGAWEDADVIADAVFTLRERFEPNSSTARLFTNCGNVLANRKDANSYFLYREAISCWGDPYQIFSTNFRVLVSRIKRLEGSDVEGALQTTTAAAFDYAADNQHRLNFALAMVNNILSLHYTKRGDKDQAFRLIVKAGEQIGTVDPQFVDVDSSIVNRYKLQVFENKGLFLSTLRQWDQAIVELNYAVSFSREYHPESLGEALSFLGFALVSAGRSEEALDVLLEAKGVIDKQPFVEKQLQLTKMLVVVNDDMGDDAMAEYWCTKLDELEAQVTDVG